jgi:hypothetical protein
MKTVEVILKKDSQGRTVTSFRCPVDEKTIKRKKQKVVQTRYGRVIVFDFKTGRAAFWMAGTPDDRQYTDIIFKD